MIEQGILDQQDRGDQLRMQLQTLPGFDGALIHLTRECLPLLAHLSPGCQQIRFDLRCLQRQLACLEGTLELRLLDQACLLEGIGAA
ncbi:hypothetical protein D3C81_2060140 [compost metagenome]